MSRLRLAACIILALFLALAALVGAAGWYFGFHDRGLNFDFDAARLAASETRMWQAYYAGNGEEMAMEMVALLREQFGVSYKTAAGVVEPMARGAMTFFRAPGDYERQVLPHLETAYARLGEACGRDWDPRAAAEAELAWWVARRTPGEDAPEQVGAKIARLYAILYGETNADIEQAGLQRAQAAALRDAGGPDADWAAVEQLLLQSYTALRKGIREKP